MFLTDDELAELTGRTRRPAQIKQLRGMCIQHLIRPDGCIVVLRSHVEGLLGGAQETKVQTPTLPDWDALDRVTKTA